MNSLQWTAYDSCRVLTEFEDNRMLLLKKQLPDKRESLKIETHNISRSLVLL